MILFGLFRCGIHCDNDRHRISCRNVQTGRFGTIGSAVLLFFSWFGFARNYKKYRIVSIRKENTKNIDLDVVNIYDENVFLQSFLRKGLIRSKKR